MHFVDDVDLVARGDRGIGDRIDDLADVVDTRARGGVHLDDVDVPGLGDGHAGLAAPAGLDLAGRQIAAGAVQGAGDDPGRRRLAHSAHAGEQIGMGHPPRAQGVGERAHHRLLADEFGESLRPVLAREHPVGACGVSGHRP